MVRIRGPMIFEKILGSREIELSLPKGSTVQDLLEELDLRTEGQIKIQIYDKKGTFLKGTRIFLNGRDTRFLAEKELRFNSGDQVLFLPLLSGG